MFASLLSVRQAVDALVRDFDAGSLTAAQSVRAVRELSAIRNVVDGLVAKAAKRVADTDAHRRSGARSAESLLATTLGATTGEARDAIDTATKLEALPATDRAVRDGKLSERQARMIADAASANRDAERRLLAAAAQGMVALRDACLHARAEVEDDRSRAVRQRRLRSLRTWTDDDGMLAGRFRLTPEVGGQVKAAIDAEVQRIFRTRRTGGNDEPHEAYAADALANFVLGDSTGRGVKSTVHVVIDHGALMRGGPVDGETCEIPGVGPVDTSWVRDLIGSAFLTAIIKRGKDILTVAHLGRHVPAEVQTALVVSGRECDIEACACRGYLERDHEHGYAKGGLTAYSNLGWLCWYHHQLKTKGWILGPRNPVTGKRTLRPPPARAA
jgi:hypothetical protein